MNELLIKEALKLLELSKQEQNKDEILEYVERAINFIQVSIEEADKYRSFYNRLGAEI